MCSFQGWRVCVVYYIDYKDQIYLIKVFSFFLVLYLLNCNESDLLVEFALLLIFHTISFFLLSANKISVLVIWVGQFTVGRTNCFWVFLTANEILGCDNEIAKTNFWDYNLNVCMVLASDSWTSTMKNSIMVFLYNENCFDNDDEINFLEKCIFLYLESRIFVWGSSV